MPTDRENETERRAYIRVIGLHKAIHGQQILCGLDLDVSIGDTTVILGASGAGKSVLLKHLIGLMPADAGQIIIDGHDIARLKERELFATRRKIGMLFQNGALFDFMTVGENVGFPLQERSRLGRGEIEERVQEALDVVGLGDHKNKMPVALSGGMRKRVALARAVITRPECILYDEPTAGLDPVISDSINRLIRRLQARFQVTSIVVTHDLASAYHVADTIAYMREGRIYTTGTPDEIRGSKDPLVSDFVNGRSGDTL